jgi:hypothetical protein
LNPPAITCLDAQTAVRRSFLRDKADIEADDRFRTFFDLESAHEGIFCRNIAAIPQENNRREDNFSVFSKILARDGCCAPAARPGHAGVMFGGSRGGNLHAADPHKPRRLS